MAQKIRYGAGGVPYYDNVPEPKFEDEALEISRQQSKKAKQERVAKKKKQKVIQEIMGDNLNENKETLDEII
tara:strand:- start:870 stop:1085 length:216 start_codon:yes stop_codon:yes gene_type:complete